MNKSFVLKNEDCTHEWRIIDATDRILGRLATEIAVILRGKDKPSFTPHSNGGDYVVVINSEKVKLTGKKQEQKIYRSYSGWMGGQKERSVAQVLDKDPTFVIKHAVKGMLPKNKLSDAQIKRLKIYTGDKHPHSAQIKG